MDLDLCALAHRLSGPEYAWRFIEELERMKVPYRVNTSVTALSSDRIATVVSPDGVEQIKAESHSPCYGMRERTRGALAIPGERPSGVFTAASRRIIQIFIIFPWGKRP